jgi:hypothetical protein
MDYKSGTATLNKSYVYGPDGTTVTETIYNYTNFGNLYTTGPKDFFVLFD